MVKVSRFYRSVPGFRRIKRAWRSRGFGIHSPFAFRFITCVLRQRSPYYGYDRLRSLADGRSEFRRAALIFRLVCEFVPDTVVVEADLPAVISASVRLADSRIRLVESGSMDILPDGSTTVMLICGKITPDDADASQNSSAGHGLIDSIFSQGGVVVILDADRRSYLSLARWMKYGMSFTNRRTAIFFSRADLPRQDFEVNF